MPTTPLQCVGGPIRTVCWRIGRCWRCVNGPRPKPKQPIPTTPTVRLNKPDPMVSMGGLIMVSTLIAMARHLLTFSLTTIRHAMPNQVIHVPQQAFLVRHRLLAGMPPHACTRYSHGVRQGCEFSTSGQLPTVLNRSPGKDAPLWPFKRVPS